MTADWLKGTGYTAEAGISLNLNDADKWISGTFDGTVHKKTVINPVGIHDECIKEQRNTYNEATTQAVKAFVDGLK